MAAQVAIWDPRNDPFYKIKKLYQTARQHFLENDITELHQATLGPFKNQATNVIIEFYFQVEFIIEPLKKRRSRRRRSKGQGRTNQLVKTNAQAQNFPYNQILMKPLTPPATTNVPIDWAVNIFLMYFKDIEKMIKEKINKTIDELSEDNLICIEALTKDLEEFLHKLGKLYHEETIVQSAFTKNQQFQEILDCTDRLQSILDRLIESDATEILDSLDNDVIKPSQDQYLASILGFDQELVTYFEESDNYYSDEQLVLDFIQDKDEETQDQEFTSWEDAFKKLGFTEIKSKILGELAIANPYSSHETPAQWASRYIEEEFNTNILLSSSRNENIWNSNKTIDFEYEIPTNVANNPVKIKVINKKLLGIEALNRDKFFADYLAQKQIPMEGITYWFHGTTHDFAKNIIREGIKVEKGKKKLDFSDDMGFYLTR